MSRRLRTLIGAVGMIVFVGFYATLAMALAESRIQGASKLVQAIAYAVLGIAWVLPMLPLIKWMEGPKRG